MLVICKYVVQNDFRLKRAGMGHRLLTFAYAYHHLLCMPVYLKIASLEQALMGVLMINKSANTCSTGT